MENRTFVSRQEENIELFPSDHMDQESFNEYSLTIQKRIDYYKEENAKFEMIFNQCKLRNNELCGMFDSDTEKMLNEVCNIQVTFGTMNFCPSEFSMSYMDYLSNNTNNYLSLLKTTIKLYMGINEKLTEEINIITRELEESKKNVVKDFNFSDEEIYALEKKVSVYESELEKFEKKHPWLRNPQLDLIHISKECQILADQQEEKEALEKELVTYQGLKPDIQEASRQLFATKKLYEELKSKLRSGV